MIPKVIWQTHEYDFKDLPYPYNINAKSWIDKNPRFKYKYINAEGRRMQLEKLRPDMLEVYDNVPSKITQSDIWRYAVLSEYGGFYADLDSVCIQPLNLDLSQETIVINMAGHDYCNGYMETEGKIEVKHVPCKYGVEFHSTINNSHFASSPKNKIFAELLDEIKENFYKEFPDGVVGDYYMGHNHISDPFVFSRMMFKYAYRVSPTIDWYEGNHQDKNKNCLEGVVGPNITICHGNAHKDVVL